MDHTRVVCYQRRGEKLAGNSAKEAVHSLQKDFLWYVSAVVGNILSVRQRHRVVLFVFEPVL